MASFKDVENGIAEDEVPVPIPIFQKNGDPYLARDGKTQCTISVLGSDSKKVRNARDAIQRRYLNATAKKKWEPADVTRNRVEKAVAGVTGWSGWDMAEEQELPYSDENAKALVAAEHILEQVEEGIEAHASFFKMRSAT